ncbi:hypothetical protein TNCV_3934761 [Trichonephila clavipes]|nr:hypothetical protein TNCV_3934761 [Trichonephila clavipes]
METNTKPHPTIVQTQATIKKVKSLILKENPPTPRLLASKLGMSFGTDINKVELHMDKAPSSPSKSTTTYLAKEETGIKCIPFDEICVKILLRFCNGLLCFPFFNTILRKTAPKNTERTMVNGSRGRE